MAMASLFIRPSRASALGAAPPKLIVHYLSLTQALILSKGGVMLINFLLLLIRELTWRIQAGAPDIRVVDLGLGASVE
jgi:hypothetical protein